MSEKITELKPCPFCKSGNIVGDECVRVGTDWSECWRWECLRCGACGPSDDIDSKARAAWNTRPEEDRLKAENAELVEALKFYRDQWDWGPANHGMTHMVPSGELLDDRGEKARAILSKHGGGK